MTVCRTTPQREGPTMRHLICTTVSLLLVSVSSLAAQELDERQMRQVFTNSDFSQPVFLTHAGDGSNRLFVVERGGNIEVLANTDGATASSFLDIRDRVNDGPGEGGLLSVAFHLRYAENGRFYVYYT